MWRFRARGGRPWPSSRAGGRWRAPAAANPPGGKPTPWTPSCAPAGIFCVTAIPTTRPCRFPGRRWIPGCRWTSTWAASNTPSCTCCTRASSPRCCAIAVCSVSMSPSPACSPREWCRASPTKTPTAADTSRRRTWPTPVIPAIRSRARCWRCSTRRCRSRSTTAWIPPW